MSEDKKNSTFVSKAQEEAYKRVFDSVPKHPTMSRLTVFLYLLMRDHLTPGVVASLMVNTFEGWEDEAPCELSNGYLAQFAEHCTMLLQRPVEEPKEVPKEDEDTFRARQRDRQEGVPPFLRPDTFNPRK